MKYIPFCDHEKEPVVRLAVKRSDVGSCVIDLVAVDENGDTISSGRILGIRADGTMYRYIGVNPTLGFQCDSEGRIKADGVLFKETYGQIQKKDNSHRSGSAPLGHVG